MKATHEIWDTHLNCDTGMKWDKKRNMVQVNSTGVVLTGYLEEILKDAGFFLKPIKPMQMENK